MLGLAASGAAAQSSQSGTCNNLTGTADFEIGIRMDTTTPYTIVMVDMTTGLEAPGSRRTINSQSTQYPANSGCHYFAFYDNSQAGVPNRVQYEQDRLYRIDLYPATPNPSLPGASYYYYACVNLPAGANVFCPRGDTGGNPDVILTVGPTGVKAYPVELAANGPMESYEDFTDGWVLPYDYPTICAEINCSNPENDSNLMFLTRAPAPGIGPTTKPIQLTSAYAADWRVPVSRSYNWSGSDVSVIQFGGAGRLTAKGGLSATGMTMTASTTLDGWRGIVFDGAPSSVLDATQVTGVRFDPNAKDHTNAVTAANGAFLTIRNGSRVAGTVNGGGVGAVSAEEIIESIVVIEGSLTEIEFNDFAGVSAEAGGDVTVRSGAQVQFNLGGGVQSSAYGSVVSLDRGAVVSNTGTGALAVNGGLVRTTSPAIPQAWTLVNSNHGGLSAKAGGSIQMGSCTGGLGTCTNAGHQIQDNSQNGTLEDARSVSGSAVRAQGNDWGVPLVGCLLTYADGSSTLLVSPIIPSGTVCSTPGGEGRGVAVSASAVADTEPDEAARMSDVVLAFVVAAEEALAAGDETSAFASILAALAASESDDDVEGAFAGVSRMFAVAQPATAVAAVETYAVGSARPWALGALAVAYARSARPAEADAAAAALETEFAGTDHAARGLGIRARLAAGARDEAAALAHLVALYDAAPESASFTTAVAVVAAAFPEADLDAVLSAPFAGKSGLSSAGGSPTSGSQPVGVTVWPNPTSASARVTVGVEMSGTLDVAVFDAVGRRVAVLADGEPVESGVFSAEVPVADLPAGVYLVRVAQHTASRPVVVSVARLTVLR